MVKLSDLKVGKKFEFKYGPINRDMIKEYAKASTDGNNIHTDDEYAAKMGLKGVIAHGMLSFGIATRFVNDLVGAGKIIKIDGQMRGMVRPGDEYLITITVKDIKGNVVTLDMQEMSKTSFKIEKNGAIVKKFEAEERGWLDEKDAAENLIKTENVPEGVLTYRLRLAIPMTIVAEFVN
jgi:acyl dehydratase